MECYILSNNFGWFFFWWSSGFGDWLSSVLVYIFQPHSDWILFLRITSNFSGLPQSFLENMVVNLKAAYKEKKKKKKGRKICWYNKERKYIISIRWWRASSVFKIHIWMMMVWGLIHISRVNVRLLLLHEMSVSIF